MTMTSAKLTPSRHGVDLPSDACPRQQASEDLVNESLDIDWPVYDTDLSDISDDDEVAVSESQPTSADTTGWVPWGYKHLKKLVKKAKGAASKPVLDFIKKHMRGTKLIFVMGQTGTGKTTILRELTGLDLEVGHTMKSGTLQYFVCPAVIDGEQYLFVDTAGFGGADLNNASIFQDIMSCLTVLGPFVTVAGVLFVYGFPKVRMSIDDLRTIRWIECFCGPEFFQNITIVTSQWDLYGNQRSFSKTWNRLVDLVGQDDVNRILYPPGRFHGGILYHHGFPEGQCTVSSFDDLLYQEDDSVQRGDELRNLIRRRYANVKPIPLQIVREMEQKIPIHQTEAGKVIASEVTLSQAAILDNRVVLLPLRDGTKSKPYLEEPEIGAANDRKASNPEAHSSAEGASTSNKGKPKEDAKKEPSWLQRIIQWVIVARNASAYYQEAKKNSHESNNKKKGSSGPSWTFWSSIKDWWFGS